MPYNERKQKEAIEGMLSRLEQGIYVPVGEAELEVYVTPEPGAVCGAGHRDAEDGQKRRILGQAVGLQAGSYHRQVPEAAKGKKAVLYIDVHGELCVFDREGVPGAGADQRKLLHESHVRKPEEARVCDCGKSGRRRDG